MFKSLGYLFLRLTKSLAFASSTRRASLSSWGFVFLTVQVSWAITAPAVLAQDKFSEQAKPALRQVIAVVPRSWPPQYNVDENGKPIGFAIDVMEEIAIRANLQVSYRIVNSFPDVEKVMREGLADLIPNSGITLERAKDFSFTAPVETFVVSLFVRNNAIDIEGLSDLIGRRVGAVVLNVGENILKERKDIEAIVYRTAEEALLGLISGQIDALIFPQAVMTNLARKANIEDRIKVVGNPLMEIKRAIRVQKHETELLAALDAAIKVFVGTPEYRQIYAKWYGKRNPYWTVNRVIWIMGALSAFVLIVSFWWRHLSVMSMNKAITKSEERYRILVQGQADLICRNLSDGTLLFVNDAYCRYFGKTADELVGTSNLRFIPEESHRFIRDIMTSLSADKPTQSHEHEVISQNGQRRWQQWTITAMFDETGEVNEIVAVGRDTTERKHMEEALRDSEALLRRSVLDAPNPIMIHAEDGEVLMINKKWTELSGYSHSDLPTLLDWTEKGYGANKEHMRDHIGGFHEIDEPIEIESYVTTARSERRIWNFRAAPLGRLQDGRRFVISMAIDVTERKEWERTLSVHARQQAAAAEIHRRALVGGDLSVLLAEIVVLVAQALDVEFCKVLKLLPGNGGFLFWEGVGWKDGLVGTAVVGAEAEFQAGYTLLCDEPVIVEDFLAEERFSSSPLLHDHGVVSGMSVVIPGPAGPFGVLGVYTATGRKFTVDDANFLQAIAHTMATVIEYDLADRELRKLSRAVEQSPASVIVTDTAGNIEYVNPKFTAVTGYAPEEVIGRNPRILNSGHTPPEEYRELWASIASGREWRGELRNKKKNGELFWESALISPIRNAAGQITNFLAVKEDITAHKLSMDALRESEERYRDIVENVGDLIQSVEPDGRYQFVNNAWKEVLGYDAEDLETLTFADVVHEDHLPRCQEIFEGLKHGESFENMEVVFKAKDGRAVVVEGHLGSVLENGEMIRSRAIFRDITARKAAEQALRESEAYKGIMLETALDSIITMDEEGKIVEFNRAAEQTFGYRGEAVRGREIADLIVPPDLREKHRQSLRRYVTTGRGSIIGKRVELRAMRAGGGEFPIELAITFSEAGGRRFFTAFIRDITERKRAEEALRESEEKFRTVLDHAPAKIHIKDLEGRYILVNNTAEELFGVTDQEARGKTAHEIFSKERADEFAAHDQDVSETGVVVENEEEWLREDGVHTFLTVKFPILDASGKTIAVGAIGTDITERKAAEAERASLESQLRESQKMEAVGTLARGIAHDFNNILAGMTGYAHLAMDAVPAESQVHGDLEHLLKSIDRATSLVKQILAFSRRSEAARHPVEIGRVVEETLELLRASIPSTVELRPEIDREAGTVMGDATQLQQVVMNLCTNAADAIGPGSGAIEVALARVELDDKDTATRPDLAPGSYVKLSVSDSGAGMDAATRARAFEPFFTTKEPGKGTGLGLSVVHGIVREHGGTIEVDSEPGRGTTFAVLLPRAEAVERGVAREARDIPRGRERILLVDDEAAIVHSEARLLERLGYQVEAATSSVGALEVFRAAPEAFDLVITDQAMPELSGMALAQEMLKLRGDTPIILCSGFSEVVGAEDAMAAGIHEFMTKPIHPDDLARAVRRVLDGDT